MLLVGAIVILVIPWSHDPLLCAAITPELEVIPAPDLEIIPAYPHRQAVCRTGGNVVSTFQTDDSPAQVHTFYRETLANSGWDVTEQDDNRSTFSRGPHPG
jgi:hypothetical protein